MSDNCKCMEVELVEETVNVDLTPTPEVVIEEGGETYAIVELGAPQGIFIDSEINEVIVEATYLGAPVSGEFVDHEHPTTPEPIQFTYNADLDVGTITLADSGEVISLAYVSGDVTSIDTDDYSFALTYNANDDVETIVPAAA